MNAKWLQLQRIEFGRWAYIVQSFLFPLLVAVLALAEIWVPSVVILIIGKWRSVMFPPRFWPVTLRKAIVDLSVGGAYIMLQWRLLSPLYEPGLESFAGAIVVMGAYLLWLIGVRHKDTMRWHRIQGLVSLVCGYLVVDNVLINQSQVAKLIVLAVIFYTAYRHLFFSVKEGLEHVRAVVWTIIMLQFWLVLDRYYIENVVGSFNVSLAAAFTAAYYVLSSFIYDEKHHASMRYYGIGMGLVVAALVAVIYFEGAS